MVLLLVPLALLVVYFGGYAIMLGMPGFFETRYPAGELGEAMSVLEVTYRSNLFLTLYLIFAAIIMVVLACTWCRAAWRKFRKGEAGVKMYIVCFTIVVAASTIGFSYLTISGNNLFDIISEARTDTLMLEGGATEKYTGVVANRGLEKYAGVQNNSKPEPYYELRILNSGSNWGSVYCPVEMAMESGVYAIGTEQPFREVVLEYMTNTGVVTSISFVEDYVEPSAEDEENEETPETAGEEA